MKYKSLRIENLRGIDKLEINDFRQVNLFVGENNCGKTTVLEALFLITGISNPQLPFSINQLRGLNYILGDDKEHQLIYHKLNYENKVVIEAELDEQKRKLIISPHKKSSENNEINTTLDKNFFEKLLSLSTSMRNQLVDGYVYDITISKKGISDFYKAAIYPDSQGILYQLRQPQNYRETLNSTIINAASISNQLPQSLDMLIKTKQIGKVIEVLSKIDKTIKNIVIGADNLIYCDAGLEQLVPINVMGDGIRRSLSIIVTIANFANGCVLIDEVENGFHFKSIEIIWRAIFEAAKKYNVQIFAVTHSIECVKAFRKAYLFEKNSQKDEQIRLFRLEKNIENGFQAVAFDLEMLEIALEKNWEVR